MRKFLLVAGLAALVSGCGEKGDFEKAINAKISQSKLCYSLQDNDIVFNKGFPIKVNRGYRSAGYSASDEILKGLVEQALLTVSQQVNGFSSVDVLEVTDKGQEVEFWDREKGACVGHREVSEIKEWTEPETVIRKLFACHIHGSWRMFLHGWTRKRSPASRVWMNLKKA